MLGYLALYTGVAEFPCKQYCIFASSSASASDIQSLVGSMALREVSDVETYLEHGPSLQVGFWTDQEQLCNDTRELHYVLLSHIEDLLVQMEAPHF